MIAYSDIRPDLRTGDVCLASGRGLFQRIVRIFTGETANHVGLIVVDDGVWVAEMREGLGFQWVPLSQWLSERHGQRCWIGYAPPPVRGNEDVVKFAHYARDKRPAYGWRTLLRVWWSQITGRPVPGSGWVCSTFVADAWRFAGFRDFDSLPDPGDFFSLCVLVHAVEIDT